jgi:hypothetical protein
MVRRKKLKRASGALTPAEAPAAGTRKPGRKPRPARVQQRKEPAPASSSLLAELAPFVVTTIRLKPTHWRALHTEALNRAGAGKRADASAVLRDILDDWLLARRE